MPDHLCLTPVHTNCNADTLSVSQIQARQARSWPLPGMELKQSRRTRDVSQVNALLPQEIQKRLAQGVQRELQRFRPYPRDIGILRLQQVDHGLAPLMLST